MSRRGQNRELRILPSHQCLNIRHYASYSREVEVACVLWIVRSVFAGRTKEGTETLARGELSKNKGGDQPTVELGLGLHAPCSVQQKPGKVEGRWKVMECN